MESKYRSICPSGYVSLQGHDSLYHASPVFKTDLFKTFPFLWSQLHEEILESQGTYFTDRLPCESVLSLRLPPTVGSLDYLKPTKLKRRMYMLNTTTVLKEKKETSTPIVAFDFKGNPIELEGFVDFDARENLVDFMSSINKDSGGCSSIGGLDLSGSWIETHISGQKPYTHRLANIWQCQREKETSFLSTWHYRGIASHRLSRFLNNEKKYYHTKKKLSLHNGAEVDVLVSREFIHLNDDPILYIQYQEDGDDVLQQKAFEDSVEEIKNGLLYQGVMYEYAFSSGSQLRELKGVMVREDYILPDSYLNKFDMSIEGMDVYLKYLKGLRGAECILETMTYGAYSHEFSNNYKQFKVDEHISNEEFEEIFASASKFMSRVGAAGTATETLGTGWRVKRIGEVRYEWTEQLEEMFLNYKVTDYRGKTHTLYTKQDVAAIKNMWSHNKLDGQSIGRASTIRDGLKKIGMKVKYEDIVGRLLQIRWAGVKGTVLVLDDKVLDMCRDSEGNKVYEDYDMIIEDNSWKYSPTKWYTGKVAPELELVNISKKKFSNNLNYQFLLSLDGNGNDPEATLDVLKDLVDEQLGNIKRCMTDTSVAAQRLGMTDRAESPLEGLGIDEYAMTQRSKITKALAKSDEVIYDKWFRMKFLNLFRKVEDECKLGKIEVEGANRYIISDPIGMLRTDLMVFNERTGLHDIVIDKFDDVALKGMTDCYWAGKEQEALLFRSPCIHPGEPQRITLTDKVPEVIKTGYGMIPVGEIYRSIQDLVIINGFSNILECMGGADTDGDTCLCVTDPKIVRLRDHMRKPLLVNTGGKEHKVVINKQSIKDNMVFSLKNNGIGLVTNYATTWRDIQLHVLRKKSLTPTMRKELIRIKSVAFKNSNTRRPWVMDDPSIAVLIEMDLDNWASVYKTCNAVLKQLRVLQEMSINTAKTGVFIDFGTTDPTKNNYNHLSIKIRPDWHKPHSNNTYKSGSVMAALNKYVVSEWSKLEEWAMATSSTLLPGAKADFGVEYIEVFNTVNSLRANYGSKAWELQNKRNDYINPISREEFNVEFGIMTDDIHTKLTILAAKYGVDLIAVAAYDASNKDSRSKKSADGTSFVWNCFFEEFLATLEFLDKDRITHRIHKIFLNDKFTYERFLLGGPSTITEGVVSLGGVEIGTSPLGEGAYDAVIIEGVPYLKVPIMRDTIEELTTTLKGTKFAIVGCTRNPDKVAGEGMLSSKTAREYLESPLGDNIIVTRAIRLGDSPKLNVGCYIRSIGNSMMLIGVIPMEEKTLANALDSKAFKVSVPEVEKETDSRLVIQIEKVLKDMQ